MASALICTCIQSLSQQQIVFLQPFTISTVAVHLPGESVYVTQVGTDYGRLTLQLRERKQEEQKPAGTYQPFLFQE